MKIVLYSKNKFGKFYICDYKSNIEFTHTNALHLATVFDTITQRDEIYYLKNTFGFNYKSEKVTSEKIEQSKNLNRVYL